MARQVGLLINPSAGRGRGSKIGRQAAAHLRGSGLQVDELIGRDVREAADLAAEAVDGGVDALVVVGGDGMVHLGVQSVAAKAVPLGVIPAGTGNDLARAVDLPLDDPGAAAEIVVQGNTRQVDLGRSSGQWFAGVVAAGFDARVNDRVNRMRGARGALRYNMALLAELGTFRPISYHLEIDDDATELDAMLIAVANIPSYGGGIPMAPDAAMDDGVFDVVVVAPVSKGTLLRLSPRLRRGAHLTHPAVSVVRGTRVKLDAPDVTAYVDGERLGPLPRTFESVPSALCVLAPATNPR